MKKYLFLIRKLPGIGNHAQESMDMLLTTAVFDQQVSVLFIDDGIWQLKSDQNANVLALKNISSMLSALEFYDVHDIYVETDSLQVRGLNSCDLILPVTMLKRMEINKLLKSQDVIISD